MILDLIQLACNQALEHDLVAQKRLEALQDRFITVEILGVNRTITVNPQHTGNQKFELELALDSEQQADVTLTATTKALLEIARYGMDNADLQSGELTISGDPIIAQRFSSLVTELDIDWEALLAEHFGDLPAAFLNQGFVAAKSALIQGQSLLKSRVQSFVKQDLDVLANYHDVDDFLSDVDDLRAAVDRLSTRINVLQTVDSI